MPLGALPYVLLLGLLFGSTLVASRFGVSQFSPTAYIGLRLLLAGSASSALYALSPGRHWPRDRQLWWRAGVVGVLGTAIPMTAIVTSLRYQSSGVTAILITANPALTVLFAHVFLADERLTPRKVTGIGLALGGALLLALLGESGLPDVAVANPIGYALVLLAMVLGSGTTVYMRRSLRQYAPLDVSTVRFLVAAAAVIPLAVAVGGFDLTLVDGRGYAVLLYASLVGTFGALLLAFTIVKRFGATAAAMTAYVIPVVATIGGALVLRERVSHEMVGGMFLIGLGIALIQTKRTGSRSAR